MNNNLTSLPSELFRTILKYLSAEDIASLSQTCRRLHSVTCDANVWRNQFFYRYQYFTRKLNYFIDDYYLSEIATRYISSSDDESNWQRLFQERANIDKHIRQLLNEIIENRRNRIYHIEIVSSTYGLLAVDFLKKHFPSSTLSFEQRQLQNEYYSLEMFRLICREMGVNLLRALENQSNISGNGRSLINALYIIQCFHPCGVLLSLSRLRTIGVQILNNSSYSTSTLSEKCHMILSKMHDENFLPAKSGNSYYDIENSFLYSAFNGKPTIPLTLVSIFCAIAEECQLEACPVGFPGEVMAQVNQPSSTEKPLIVSVYHAKIVGLEELNGMLADVLETPLTHPISETPIKELVIRSARNMIHCITKYSTSSLNCYGLYASVCVLKILGNGEIPLAFDPMFSLLKEHFPMDMCFFESLSSPASETYTDLRRIRHEDSHPNPVAVKSRSLSTPKFYIGQICQHVHYKYWAVIYGWDPFCTASALWQIRMGVSNLPRASQQPYYHVLAMDSSKRYVAEDNIDTSAFETLDNDDNRSETIRRLCDSDGIGKYFQRFDTSTERFVLTNELQQEYPEEK